MVACHPIALAASAAALLGIDELIDAWPLEMTTIFLPLAAGRAVPSGCRRVPVKCLATAASIWALPGPLRPAGRRPGTPSGAGGRAASCEHNDHEGTGPRRPPTENAPSQP